jgi:hypothetical protein
MRELDILIVAVGSPCPNAGTPHDPHAGPATFMRTKLPAPLRDLADQIALQGWPDQSYLFPKENIDAQDNRWPVVGLAGRMFAVDGSNTGLR